MELPEDIHSYLERYLKPKKYTLLNKFCRDFYFRKNGLRIKNIGYFEYRGILPRYHITLLELQPQKESDFKIFKTVAENVLAVTLTGHGYDGRACDISAYIIARRTFPDLKRMDCILSLDIVTPEQFDEILGFKPLPGTLIKCFDVRKTEYIEILARNGYNLELGGRISEWGSLDVSIRERVMSIVSEGIKIDVEKFSNLVGLRGCTRLDEYTIRSISAHPSLKYVEYYSRCIIPREIIKKDGTAIKNIMTFPFDFNFLVTNIEYYDEIKKYYYDVNLKPDMIDQILEMENLSNNPKRLKLTIRGEIKPGKMSKLLKLFDIIFLTSAQTIKFYLSEYKKYEKRSTIYGMARCTFRIGNGKLTIREI